MFDSGFNQNSTVNLDKIYGFNFSTVVFGKVGLVKMTMKFART